MPGKDGACWALYTDLHWDAGIVGYLSANRFDTMHICQRYQVQTVVHYILACVQAFRNICT